MKRLPYLVFAMIAICSFSFSQQKILVIYGKSDVTEIANRAEFTFVVEKDGNSLKEAFAEAQAYLNSLFRELKTIGIDSSSIQQSRVRVNEKDLTWFTSKKYKAVLRTKIVIDNISSLESVLEIIGKYEIEYLSEIEFSLKNYDALTQRAYNEAVKNAKNNAFALAKSQGLSLGDISSIVEETEQESQRSYPYLRGAFLNEASFSKKGAYAFASSIIPEQILYRKMLKVTFLIN